MSIINYLAIKPILISQIQLQNFSPKLISSINSQNPSLSSLHGPRSAPPFSINPDQHPPFLHKIHQIQPILLPWTKPRPPTSNPVTLHSPKTNTIRERTLKKSSSTTSTINFPQPPSTQRWSSIPPSQNLSQSSRSFNHTSQSNPSSLLLPISHHHNPSSHSPNKNQNHLQPLNREPPEASPTVVFNPYQPSLSFWPSHTENHPVYILQQQLNWIESYKNIIV